MEGFYLKPTQDACLVSLVVSEKDLCSSKLTGHSRPLVPGHLWKGLALFLRPLQEPAEADDIHLIHCFRREKPGVTSYVTSESGHINSKSHVW